MDQEILSQSTEATQQLARRILDTLSPANTVLLYGDLGSGKTTFTQGIGKALGIKKNLNSPTFIIVRSYDIPSTTHQFKKLYHIDLYRTETEHDLKSIGLKEILSNPENLVVIEWAEKIGELLPEKCVYVRFEYVDEEKRKIVIT